MSWFKAVIPLRDEGPSRSLVTFSAIMVFLAALALSGAFVVQNVISRWHADISGALTVQITPQSGTAPDAVSQTDADVARVADILSAEPGVDRVEIMTDGDLKALMEPWLGSADIVADFPLPRLISVALKENARPDIAALESRLQAVVPGVVVEDHGRWLSGLVSLARSLSILAWLTVALVAVATSVAVVQATRSSLRVHWPMIELLHLIGARDAMISRRFERGALVDGVLGGVIGVGLAFVAIGVIGFFARGVEGGLVPDFRLTTLNWAALIALPVLSGLLALAATRWAVLRALGRML